MLAKAHLPTSGATVKLPTYQRKLNPVDPVESEHLRTLIVRAVVQIYNESHRPTDLKEIYDWVIEHLGDVDYRFHHTSKRSVDRRVNEAASKQHGAKIVAVSAGIYQPSPQFYKWEVSQ